MSKTTCDCKFVVDSGEKKIKFEFNHYFEGFKYPIVYFLPEKYLLKNPLIVQNVIKLLFLAIEKIEKGDERIIKQLKVEPIIDNQAK